LVKYAIQEQIIKIRFSELNWFRAIVNDIETNLTHEIDERVPINQIEWWRINPKKR